MKEKSLISEERLEKKNLLNFWTEDYKKMIITGETQEMKGYRVSAELLVYANTSLFIVWGTGLLLTAYEHIRTLNNYSHFY